MERVERETVREREGEWERVERETLREREGEWEWVDREFERERRVSGSGWNGRHGRQGGCVGADEAEDIAREGG